MKLHQVSVVLLLRMMILSSVRFVKMIFVGNTDRLATQPSSVSFVEMDWMQVLGDLTLIRMRKRETSE